MAQKIVRIEDADGFGKITGPCGDTMEVFLRIKDNMIVDAMFTTDGCGTTIVCGTMVTELARGMDIEAASKINAEKVLAELGGKKNRRKNFER